MATRFSRWPASEHGMRQLSIIVALVVILILTTVAVNRLKQMFSTAERLSVQTVVRRTQEHLNLVGARALVRSEHEVLMSLDKANPFAFNDVGTSANAVPDVNLHHPTDAPPGRWVFDRSSASLLYRFEHAAAEGEAGRVLRVKARIRFRDRDGDNRFRSPPDGFLGVALDEELVPPH